MFCGGGTKVLVRECNESVPAHGGSDCDGVPYRVERCNTCPCEPIKRLGYMSLSYIISIAITEIHAVCIILIEICTIVYNLY